MTENKRFTYQRTDDYNFSDILDNGKWIGICHVDCEDDFVDKLNELHEENQQIKNLIHTMLKQIDAENITSDSAMYSAKIIFSRNEFSLIRELWKRTV